MAWTKNWHTLEHEEDRNKILTLKWKAFLLASFFWLIFLCPGSYSMRLSWYARVTLFGLCNTPMTFEWLMHILLLDIPSLNYFAIITAYTAKAHSLDITCRFRQANLKFNAENYISLKFEVTFMTTRDLIRSSQDWTWAVLVDTQECHANPQLKTASLKQQRPKERPKNETETQINGREYKKCLLSHFQLCPEMHAMAKRANLEKNRQIVCQNLHEVVRGAPYRVKELIKNGESGKNWPWVWQILKLDDKKWSLGEWRLWREWRIRRK